ncbi:hypothetical protein NDU88_003911 [Pleurodeles waltl]|uniref:Uncharacterized protein n=1 Tax=Pleurodeles waltl TaxID=8319 RepID=A0AAV7M6R9_PLEWA|nr:hypothetical protein NDU88_003911 [Pleurodeles waltl]
MGHTTTNRMPHSPGEDKENWINYHPDNYQAGAQHLRLVGGLLRQSTSERPLSKKVHDAAPRRRDSSNEKSQLHRWNEGACRSTKEDEEELCDLLLHTGKPDDQPSRGEKIR